MQTLKLNFTTTAGVPSEELAALYTKLKPEHERLTHASHDSSYRNESSCMYTPFDTTAQQHVLDLAVRTLERAPSLIILIGIGGSNLGALAVHQAIQGLLYNEKHPERRFYCVDTIDHSYMHDLLQLADATLSAGKNILLIVASKSGKTLETLTNASFLITLLKRHRPSDYNRFIIFLTDAHSPLWQKAEEHTIDHMAIPSRVGGRYSVFTAATLLPLALLGIDIQKLCSGANRACLDDAALSAGLIYYHWSQGITIHNLFLFAPHLSFLGAWYRQLTAESIGKKYDLQGSVVEVGIIPLITLATTDLHSVLQLYLAGPRDIFTTFVMSRENHHDETVPDSTVLPLEPSVFTKSLHDIKSSLWQGVQRAYQKDNRPFATLELASIDVEALGAFLYFSMAQTIFLGFLLEVNPFDQPQVEAYKEGALHILAGSP